jgi:hypothetical protein
MAKVMELDSCTFAAHTVMQQYELSAIYINQYHKQSNVA